MGMLRTMGRRRRQGMVAVAGSRERAAGETVQRKPVSLRFPSRSLPAVVMNQLGGMMVTIALMWWRMGKKRNGGDVVRVMGAERKVELRLE